MCSPVCQRLRTGPLGSGRLELGLQRRDVPSKRWRNRRATRCRHEGGLGVPITVENGRSGRSRWGAKTGSTLGVKLRVATWLRWHRWWRRANATGLTCGTICRVYCPGSTRSLQSGRRNCLRWRGRRAQTQKPAPPASRNVDQRKDTIFAISASGTVAESATTCVHTATTELHIP